RARAGSARSHFLAASMLMLLSLLGRARAVPFGRCDGATIVRRANGVLDGTRTAFSMRHGATLPRSNARFPCVYLRLAARLGGRLGGLAPEQPEGSGSRAGRRSTPRAC